MRKAIRRTAEFQALRSEAQDAIVAYEDGADFDTTVTRLAEVGRVMEILLG